MQRNIILRLNIVVVYTPCMYCEPVCTQLIKAYKTLIYVVQSYISYKYFFSSVRAFS